MKNIILIGCSLALFLTIPACRYDYVVLPGSGDTMDGLLVSACDPDTVYFSNTILPLVVSSCATTGCHDESTHADGIILTDFESILRTGKIKPGNPGDSEFFEVLTDDEDLMPPPPLPVLSQEQIDQVRTWISQGAEDNTCTDGCDTSSVTFSGTVWPLMKSYCVGCHTSASPGGGIVIESYSDVIRMAGNGSLMGSIGYETGYSPMPPNTPLDKCIIDQMRIWIDKGMPND